MTGMWVPMEPRSKVKGGALVSEELATSYGTFGECQKKSGRALNGNEYVVCEDLKKGVSI